MRVYSVHVSSQANPCDPAAFDRAILVRDGFTFFAFLFTAFWFFAHRLWLAGLIVLVLVVGFGAIVSQLELSPLAAFASHLLVSSLVGLEASSLRRWTYARRGMPVVDIVTGIDYEEAEAKAAARWLARAGENRVVDRNVVGRASGEATARPLPVPAAPMHVAQARPAPAASRESEIIGLFPERSR
jgi:hypothetical protein